MITPLPEDSVGDRPTALRTHQRLALDCAAGACAGLFVGVVDALLASPWQELGGVALPLLVLMVHAGAGVLLGAALGAARLAVVASGLPARISRRAALVIAGCVVLAVIAVLWAMDAGGLELDAIAWEQGLPAVLFAPAWMALAWALTRGAGHRRARVALVAGALTFLLAFIAGLASAPRDPGVRVLMERGVSSAWSLSLLRAFHDGDGDGYPDAYCFDECDCDDGAPEVHPTAPEVFDNGLDEDCDSLDLHAEDLAAMTPAPAQVRVPPSPEPAPAHPPPTVAEPPPAPPPPPPPPWPRRFNFLLVVLDAVRADHLGCYGYDRDTSPRLDRFARDATLFTQARAQGAMTRDSVPSLLTGRYYSELDRQDQEWPVLHGSNLTLAETLRDAGYATAAISSFFYFVPQYGYAQGFQHFDTAIHELRKHVQLKRTSDLVTDRALAQLDGWRAGGAGPWFLMVQYADPHSRYLRHPEAPDFGWAKADKYDQEIWFVDHHLGRLLDGLEERELLADTVIVITSDHGEGLDKARDHNRLYHGQTMYDNLIRVPLVVYTPFGEARRVDVPVALLDIPPTLLELSGVAAPEPLSGVSLVPALAGEPFRRPPTFHQKPQPRRRAKVAMVSWPYKLIWNLAPNYFELYDLSLDPNERRNLTRRNPEVFQRLSRQLKTWRSHVLNPRKSRRASPVRGRLVGPGSR